MQKDFDNKLFTILFLTRWKTIVLITIIGALLFGRPYTLSKTVVGNFDYRSELTVHVKYGEDSSGKIYDYINFYTWKQWITSDKYMDILHNDAGLSESSDELKGYLDANVEADERVVFFAVTTHDPELTGKIADAVNSTILTLISEIPEIESGEVINLSAPVKYFVYKNIPQVFVLGAIAGLFVSCLGLRIWILLDDSVYIPALFERETGIPVSDKIPEGGNVIKIEDGVPTIGDVSGDVSLVIKAGNRNGRAIERVLDELKTKNANVTSVSFTGVDEKIVKAYYRKTTLSSLFMHVK